MQIRNLSKTFNGVEVVHHVSLVVKKGEVHALLGQNGSGKSTIIKVLSGYHEPDSGAEISLGGEPHAGRGGRETRMSFVHQDLGFVDELSIIDNLRSGRWKANLHRIHWRAERARVGALLAQFGLAADPDEAVATLSPAEKAILGIIRALDQLEDAQEGLLVLDEPTASLPRGDVDQLFKAVRDVAARGLGVLFVSHRLDEVEALADRATVIRDGRVVGTRVIAETDEQELVTMILGTRLRELYPEVADTGQRVVLEVRALRGSVARDVSFELHEGEVVGLTGLAGMGQDEVPYLLFGAVPMRGGEVYLTGERVKISDPFAARRAGLALLPADRSRQSAVAVATVKENVSITTVRGHYRRGRLRHSQERQAVLDLLERFQVVPPAPDRILSTLSGGNQQKAVLAKWLQLMPPVVMLHEPTHGVDIGSRKQIFASINEAAGRGAGVIIISGEYEDLAHLCDRVLVFRDGRVVSDLSGAAISYERITAQCYRASSEPAV